MLKLAKHLKYWVEPEFKQHGKGSALNAVT